MQKKDSTISLSILSVNFTVITKDNFGVSFDILSRIIVVLVQYPLSNTYMEKAECLNEYLTSVSSLDDTNCYLPAFELKCQNQLLNFLLNFLLPFFIMYCIRNTVTYRNFEPK